MFVLNIVRFCIVASLQKLYRLNDILHCDNVVDLLAGNKYFLTKRSRIQAYLDGWRITIKMFKAV